jgi:hypothetical protein
MNRPAAYVAMLLMAIASGAALPAERLPANPTALVAERPATARAASVLNSPAMNAMLRADRDKDGMLSREELDEYDLTLGRRFADADADRNGRLTLHELETLFAAPDAASIGATR